MEREDAQENEYPNQDVDMDEQSNSKDAKM
jgi:hypothetical protein